ncbi:Ig-like repeat domain protein 1 [Vibrio ishigakensis]|uniref:Ig-like repeat domain protein 1 n=2 Tax=Vibrio ishigakensis TaxID=1481914 RepID=A0A0B8P086_9VIBR|nr:Ig-like repeat domain protein 1 [Vibrio ishigakensis]
MEVTNHYFERLPKGATKSYRAFATYTDGKIQDVTDNAIWESTDESVATVSKDGIVKAISEGETIIYAEFQGISNDEGLEPRNLEVSGADIVKLEIPKGGEHIKLSAGGEFDYPSIVAIYSDGTKMEYGESVNLKWQSDDPTVVNTDTFFILKAVKKGQATVTASMGNMAVTFDTEVTDAKLTSIEVNGDDDTNLAIGSNVHFQATGHYEDGSTGDITQFVDWSTQGEQHSIYYDNQSSRGTVFGALPGYALITASLNGITSDFKIVRVIDKRLSSVEITKPTDAFELKYNSNTDGKLQNVPLGIISRYDDGSQDSKDRYLNVVIGNPNILSAYMYDNGNVSYATKGLGTTNIMFCTLDKVCTLPMTVNITN